MGYTVQAANDFRSLLYRVVDIGGNLSVAGGVSALGIAQTRPNSGQYLGVGYFGVMKAVAGAIITTPGYPLTTAASGYVIAAVSGSHVIGRYIQPGRTAGAACASGDQITGLFNFANGRPIGAGSGYV
jgi:hypothetical protein